MWTRHDIKSRVYTDIKNAFKLVVFTMGRKIMVTITGKCRYPVCAPTNSRNETGFRHLSVEDASEGDPNRNREDEEGING